MSYELKGSSPPPVPRRARSPWTVVGIIISVFLMVGFGGFALFLVGLTRAAQEEAVKPLDIDAVKIAFSDLPLIEGSQLDVEETKQRRATIQAMGRIAGNGVKSVAAFRTNKAPLDVLAHFSGTMAVMGYEVDESKQNLMTEFRKGKELIRLQVSRTDDEPTLYVLQRHRDIK